MKNSKTKLTLLSLFLSLAIGSTGVIAHEDVVEQSQQAENIDDSENETVKSKKPKKKCAKKDCKHKKKKGGHFKGKNKRKQDVEDAQVEG